MATTNRMSSRTGAPQLSSRLSQRLPTLLVALISTVVLVAGLPTGASAQSDAEPSSLVVFMLEGADDTADLREELTAVVREEAANSDGYRLVKDDPMVLSDTAVVLGCESVSTTCLGKAADQFDADFLVFGKIEEVGGSSRVSVRLFDAAKGRYVGSFRRVITKLEEPYDAFRSEVGSLLGPDGGSPGTVLQVRSNVEGATVQVDGEAVGQTPLDREGLEPGRHQVRVEADDHESWNTEVDLERDSTVQIRATLRPVESEGRAASQQGDSSGDVPAAPGPADRGSSSVAQWGPWVAIGAGAVALGGSGVAGGEVIRANNDLEQWREENNDTTEECETEPECDIIERGENAQTTHRVLLGVGGVTVAGGLLWLALRDVGGDSKESRAAVRHLELSVTDRSVSVGWRW